MQQVQTQRPAKPEYPKRYDKNFRDKFDAGERIVPVSEYGYIRAMRFWKEKTGKDPERSNDISTYNKLLLAEIALRCRNKVGLVVGSTARKIHDALAGDCIEGIKSSDLDVLILNNHGRANPKPFEWGIDWFVRPPKHFPTNSLVEMVYDLILSDRFHFRIDPEIEHQSSQRNIFLRDNLGFRPVQQAVQETREKIMMQGYVAPGLYLPARETLDEIADYCNSLAGTGHVKKKSYDYLRCQTEAGKAPGHDIPVLPREALCMRRRV